MSYVGHSIYVKEGREYKSSNGLRKKSYMDDFDKIINEVSSNIESFHFNKSVAKIYEYVNLLSMLVSKKYIDKEELSAVIKNLSIIIHPFIPHISEEIWYNLGGKGLCATADWPKTRKDFENKSFKMPIQINGKTRSLINVDVEEKKEDIIKKAMAEPKIKKYTENKEIVKTIYVKNKIVNLVAK